MVYSVLLLVCVFCAATGCWLAASNTNAWAVLIFTAAAIVSLQISYVATLVMRAFNSA